MRKCATLFVGDVYMLHRLSERIALSVCNDSDKIPLDVYIYGFELLVSSVIETISLLLIGLLTGKLIDTIIFIISFSSIRVFSGGYHANSYLKCFIVTVAYYLLVLFSAYIMLAFPNRTIILIAIITLFLSLILFILMSPVKSKGKSILNYKKQKMLSIISLFINAIVPIILLTLYQNNILIIVYPTIICVDVLIIIESLKKGDEKNERKD